MTTPAGILETIADDLTDAVVSHAAASGYFERVNSHEPKNPPGNGLTAAVWVQWIKPYPAGSGMRATTGLVIFNTRIYGPMLEEPQDAIDPNMLKACGALMAAYSNDFTLDGLTNVRNVDLLGASGFALEAIAGYLTIGASTLYRVMTITVPVVINDLFPQQM